MNKAILRWAMAGALGLIFHPEADAQVSSDTRMWRYGLSRTSAYPGGPSVFPLTVKWKTDGSAYSSPVLANGNVYIAYSSLISYNAGTGALNWTWTPPTAESNGLNGLPAVGSNGLLYFTRIYHTSSGKRNKVYCINAVTKAAVWSYDAGAGLENYDAMPAAVHDGKVLVVMNSGLVLALNAASGQLLWGYNINVRCQTAPAIANNTVYVAPVGKLYAIDAATGAMKWNISIPGWTQSSPAVSGGTVVLGSNDGKVHAYNATTGALKWEYNTGMWVSGYRSSPAISGGIVYIGTGDSIKKVLALDLVTGALRWSYLAPGRTSLSSPAVSNGTVYITTWEGHVLALNASTGALRWSATLASFGSQSSPAIYNNRVYVCAHDTANAQKLHSFGP